MDSVERRITVMMTGLIVLLTGSAGFYLSLTNLPSPSLLFLVAAFVGATMVFLGLFRYKRKDN